MLEQTRISTDREFEISARKAECSEPGGFEGSISSKPFVAANDVSAIETLLIQPEALGRSNPGIPSKPVRNFPSPNRIADALIAVILLIVLLPVMAIIVIYLKLTDHGAVFYAHRRVGLGGKSFNCLKFRTMCADADRRLANLLAKDEALQREWGSTQKLLCDPRVTHFGSILRNTSLDELPQLINVLRGEMSLVGPRPIIEAELRRYGRYAAHYLSVRPGLTGLWQVTRNARTSYRRRVASDVLYIRKRTLAYDFKILAATIPAVLAGNG